MAQDFSLGYGDARTTENVNGRLLNVLDDGVYKGFLVQAQVAPTKSLDLVFGIDSLSVLMTDEGVTVREGTELVSAVTIPDNVSGDPRIDAIVCFKQHSPANDPATYLVVQGTPAPVPVPPALLPHQLLLAHVNVANGFTEINDGDLFDLAHFNRPGDDRYLNESENLGDLDDVPTARTNLDIYSKSESDDRYLNESDNLSDLDDVPTAQTNLDVYSKLAVDNALALKKDDFTENTGFNKNFGTGAGDVAQGNDSRFHSNANDPTANQKAAMNAASAPTGPNPFATIADLGGGGGSVVQFFSVSDPSELLGVISITFPNPTKWIAYAFNGQVSTQTIVITGGFTSEILAAAADSTISAGAVGSGTVVSATRSNVSGTFYLVAYGVEI